MLKIRKTEMSSFLSLLTKQGMRAVMGSFVRSFLAHFRLIATACAIIAIFMGSVLVIAVKAGVEPSDLTRDLGGVLRMEPFIGSISNLGFFFWFGALTLSFLGYRLFQKGELSTRSNMYGLASMITLLLAVDDVYQLHEVILPVTLGIHEGVFYLVYLILTFAFIIRFHRELMGEYFALIVLAYLLFASSIAFDSLIEGRIPFSTYIEDTLKLSGIITWFLFFWFSVTDDLKTSLSVRRN